MALYTIADLHLSTLDTTNKSMEVFGTRWQDYIKRIEKNLKVLGVKIDPI
jgi:predicted phosphohydrolase